MTRVENEAIKRQPDNQRRKKQRWCKYGHVTANMR